MWGGREARYLVFCLQVVVGFKYAKMSQVCVFKFSPAFIPLVIWVWLKPVVHCVSK